MYQVMIVDDEVTVREKVPLIIDFGEAGFAVCATAKNGREALEALPRYQPDLVLLDVQMPVLDGLGFLEELKHSPYSDTRVIILSGYSEFKYAKKALTYGVKGYLTKPIDEEEALCCLHEIRKELDAQKQTNLRDTLLSHTSALQGIYNGTGSTAGMEEFVLMHIVILSSLASNGQTCTYQLVQQAVVNQDVCLKDALFRVRGSIYTYLLPKQVLGGRLPDSFAKPLKKGLQDSSVECVVLFDDRILQEPGESFRQDFSSHLYAMLTDVFFGQHHTACYSRCNSGRRPVRLEHEEPFTACLRTCLLEQKKDELFSAFNALFLELKQKKLELEHLQELNFRIYYLLLDAMGTVTKKSDNDEPMLQPPEWRDAPVFTTVSHWGELQRQQLTHTLEYIGRCRGFSCLGVCSEVLEYVHRNYRRTLTVRQVAEEFYMNPAYLGRVFQKVTGAGFRQYVNHLRISEAKRMLIQTDKLIYEIAVSVGYTDSKYFIVRFLDAVGMSPNEYRKTHWDADRIL